MIYETEQHTNWLGIANSSARVLPENTVCLSRTASVGYVVVMGRPMATSQDFVNWVCSSSIDHRFLKYVLMAERDSLLRFALGTTHQTIYFPEVKAFHICLPAISEQRSIADILFALDDKIELNRRMNATLEAIAQALFKSWFVDFDPVRAKADGRDPRLPHWIAELFPDRFEGSKLGDIPEGWRVDTISALAEVVGGSTPSTSRTEFWEGGFHRWATPRDLASLGSPVLLDTERHVTDAGLAQISSGLLPRGTVLLSSRAPIGYLAITDVPTAVNQGFIAMKPRESVPNVFLLPWARFSMDEILSRANGSTFLEISKSSFRPIPVVCPPASVLAAFEALAKPLHDQVASNARESHVLVGVRDLLVPKLVSGEVRSPEAVRTLEAAPV